MHRKKPDEGYEGAGDEAGSLSTIRSTTKVCFAGTHRVCPPEETFRMIRPIFHRVGITRVADVTWLDDIGIPVFQAVRPDSRLLSVSQGKGLSPALAKVSAAMESIEMWHAERASATAPTAAVADVRRELDYELEELATLRRHCLNDPMKLEWSVARRLDGGADTLVPTAFLRLDGRVAPRWEPPLFVRSTNGLASGNTFAEAALHGLYELIERDAMVSAETSAERCMVSAERVDGASGELLERLARAGVDVAIEVLPSRFDLPCFRVKIWSDTFPVVFAGCGCHRDRDVSLCRALTEAVQSRVTAIAGTRDDMLKDQYRRGKRVATGLEDRPDLEAGGKARVWLSFQEIESITSPDTEEDLRAVVARVRAVLGRAPIAVDHTRADIGIPVAHVVCPRMRFDAMLV